MNCSNCGKKIPFSGNVCPWCNADKSGDQKVQVFGFFFGMVGGGLGWAVYGPGAALVGFLVAAVGGIILAKKQK